MNVKLIMLETTKLRNFIFSIKAKKFHISIISIKAKLSVFRSVFVPILTYGHECWVMTKRVRSRVQAVKMGFLQKVRGLSLFDMV